ncbi:ribose-phosphate pyrophosphokinase [Planctomycetaceae bacterium SCGC AG-212-F19]|nr:ribose-phosphate pyrophosphokinase [Planctomycetaceae bacterium SCGC AG-212-F19]
MNLNNGLKVFSGRAHLPLAEKIAHDLDDALGRITVDSFPDGETQVRIEEDVRGRDVFIVQPTCPPVNHNLTELLIIIDCFKRASAARITAVLPYYGYARQDRKDVGRVPITAKLVANLLTVAGTNRVIALDLHAAQIQGFFDIPVDHLHARPVINDYVRSLRLPPDQFVVLSPDEGAIKRALGYQKKLGAPIAIVDKRRSGSTEVKAMNLIGASVEGKSVFIFDDMISTAGTVVQAAEVARNKGAREIYVCATHGVLCGPAVQRLKNAPIKEIVLTDSIPLTPEKNLPNIRVLSVSKLLAYAIKRIHFNESVSALFE